MHDQLMATPPTDPQPRSADPTVAVAFGGGGARGIAHIHVIDALNELGLTPVMIAGSSIGAIMGAGMASGMSGRDITDYTLATIGKRATVANRLWRLRPATVKDAVTGGFRIGQFNLERILRVFMPPDVPATFSELKIPFKVSLSDYYGQSEVMMEEGDLYQALAASAAIPALFMPVRINDRIMIDGGIFNPVPYEHLLGHADIVIGVDVVGAPEGDGSRMPTRMESLFGAGQLMMQANIALKLRLQPPHIFLRPAVNRFRVLDFLKAREILLESIGIKDELKHAIETEMERRIRL